MIEARWQKGHNFAIFAEAIGTETDKIMAAMPDDDGRAWNVLYTPEGFEKDDPVVAAKLWVEPATGIMEVVATKRLTTVGRWEREVNTLMRKAMEARDAD